MKNILCFTVIFLFLFSCKREKEVKLSALPIDKVTQSFDFDFLLGQWERTVVEEGKTTYEHWSKSGEDIYKGLGFAIMNGDTMSQEVLEIIIKNEQCELSVIVPRMNHEVMFKLDKSKDFKDGFTFNNPNNDFPKVITYKIDGDTLRAEISGGGPTIPFTFFK